MGLEEKIFVGLWFAGALWIVIGATILFGTGGAFMSAGIISMITAIIIIGPSIKS